MKNINEMFNVNLAPTKVIRLTKKGFVGEIILEMGEYPDGSKWGAMTAGGGRVPMSIMGLNIAYKNYTDLGYKVKAEKKAAAPAAPKKTMQEKMAENAEKRDEAEGYKKPKTRSEALEKKYGSLEQRRAYAIRRSQVRDECYKLLCEEVKKSGKRLPRKVFCDRLEKMVKERMA